MLAKNGRFLQILMPAKMKKNEQFGKGIPYDLKQIEGEICDSQS